MIEFVAVSSLERSIKSIFIIGLILLCRRKLNVKSIKWANVILWVILFIYLLVPYSLLIEIKNIEQYGMLKYVLELLLLIREYTRTFTKDLGYILSSFNQILVGSLIFFYVIAQVFKRNKAMKNSVLIEQDNCIKESLDLFQLKRKVDIFVNDKIKVPVTYGVIHPKIILQSHILDDDELLKYVLIHEMTHIKKCDIVFTHIKNLITCLYWHNIFILLASRYIEDDIEMLCDKLVIQKVGDTVQNRKEYCLSMLKLIEPKDIERNKIVLKLSPTKERMIVMKKWRRRLSGVFAFVLVMTLSVTVFADVRVAEKEQIVSSESSTQIEINKDDRVKEITDEEYNALNLGEIQLEKTRVANVDDSTTLSGLDHKSYKFNMTSWTEPNHDGFTVKTSEMSCRGGVDYAIMIKENGNVIYKGYFQKSVILTVKADYNSRYEVIIQNQSADILTYRVKINSYIR